MWTFTAFNIYTSRVMLIHVVFYGYIILIRESGGQFRVVPGVRDGIFWWIRTVPGLARPIPTFSTVVAANHTCGPRCVRGWKAIAWTSGSRHTSRKHVWNIKNHGDGHALGPTISALMNIQRTEQNRQNTDRPLLIQRLCCRPIVWVPRQLVAYMATFGTQFFSLKFCHRHLFM